MKWRGSLIWLCCTCTLVVDSPEGEDVGDDHRLVRCRVDALDPLGVEVLEEELLPHLAPETRILQHCHATYNKFAISHLRRRSAARSVWSTMADTASDVDSGTMSLDVTVWAIQRSARSQTRKTIRSSWIQLGFLLVRYCTYDMNELRK